jgi:hypothetical protein
MARHARLLAIAVTHEYCGTAPLQLTFVPDAACAALMLREGLLLRHTPAGAEVWREATADQAVAALPLSFQVFAADPHLPFCTDWPVARPLRYVSVGADDVLRPETLAGSGAAHAPLLSIEIDAGHGPARQDAVYRIALASKKMHWKYFFSGSLAARKLSIVDLDAGGDAAGIRFAAAAMTATAEGIAYLSEAALPMLKLPRQRLQLREEGAAGKVLIRRLPNADVAKLGKERGRDGRSMIVAEIYIHQ